MSFIPLTSADVVAAIAAQNIAPADIDPTGNITLAAARALLVPTGGNWVQPIGAPATGLRFDSTVDFRVQITSGRFVVNSSEIRHVLPSRFDNGFFGAPSTQVIAANGNTISPVNFIHELSTVAARTMSSTPTIAAGNDGEFLLLKVTGTGASSIITVQDDNTLPGSGLKLSSATIGLNEDQTLLLVFKSSSSLWTQVNTTPLI